MSGRAHLLRAGGLVLGILALTACNAASSRAIDDDDAAPADDDAASPDTGQPDDEDAREPDVPWQPDTGTPTCDPFTDDECGCADGVVLGCFGGSSAQADRGICRSGFTVCVDGAFGACEGDVLPREEQCNGLDDDCDGQVDEGVSSACGLCGAPPVETCGDGLDNDCDGLIDESDAGCDCDDRTNQPCYAGPPQTLGHGACKGGVMSCEGEAWGACEGQVLPDREICDGLDNDCDGLVDEGVTNACGTCGLAPAEICDELDNDCDGLIDEGVRLPCGLCVGETPPAERCGDGLDNDCDGDVDEGCPCLGDAACYAGEPSKAGVGACAMGTRTCDVSGEFWLTCEGSVWPTAEVCDGLDNDCDGLTDLDPRGCSVCDSGVEVCNGLDDDCDGAIDEGVVNRCGQCLDAIAPEELGGDALCNGLDDDCDGLVDEQLLNACGTCGESCYMDSEVPDDGDTYDDGAALINSDDPNNPTGRPGVTLSSRTFIPPYLWAANHTLDTVSRVHVEDNAEHGRYWVGDNPSRTAVDLDGNVWIGGRDDGRLTKILWDVESCPDRNESGTIETSRPGALGPINSPTAPLADECVVYSAVPNPSRPSIRGIAAGPDGRVWVGYTNGGIQSIDPDTFELGPFIDGSNVPVYRRDETGLYQPSTNPDGSPETTSAGGVYGLVVDSEGRLYQSSYVRTQLPRFDTTTGEYDAVFVDFPCGMYGIAIDADDRVWTGGWPNCAGVGMFDADTLRARSFAVPTGTSPSVGLEITPVDAASGCGSPSFCVTGLGVEPATGDVWASFFGIGYTGRLLFNESNPGASRWRLIGSTRGDDGALLPGVNNDFRGVGFDRNGYAWTLGLGSDRVWKVDPDTERRAPELPEGLSVGGGQHYTYSDFTGSTALTFTAPRALWTWTFDSGYPRSQLDSIEWQAFVPIGTSAGIRVRVVDGDGRPISSWYPTSGTIAFPLDDSTATVELATANLIGRYFQIEVVMSTSDEDARPIVHQVDMYWQRP